MHLVSRGSRFVLVGDRDLAARHHLGCCRAALASDLSRNRTAPKPRLKRSEVGVHNSLVGRRRGNGMAIFGKRRDGPGGRRWIRRRKVSLPGCALSIHGTRSVLVEDLTLAGARLMGRGLPEPGTEIELRVGERSLLGEVVWDAADRLGMRFDFGKAAPASKARPIVGRWPLNPAP